MAVRRLILPALALGLPDRSDAQILDGINQNQTPLFLQLAPCCVGTIGWYYTPGFSYTLTGVQVIFRGIPNPESVNRTVTLGVYSDRPGAGGALLRSSTFQSDAARDLFAGVIFAGLDLVAGTRYFIGLTNVTGLGSNLAGCTGSASMGQPPAFNTPQCATVNPPPGVTNLGAWALDTNGGTDGTFDDLINPDFNQLFAQPIIRFLGQMPPPPVDVLSRASAGIGGQPADGQSTNPRVSADGRFAVFESDARNLTTTCTTGVRQVYRRDRTTGEVVCVSTAPGSGPGNAASSLPAISSAGRFVAYQSLATNLGCASSVQQILRTDLATGQTVCVSQASGTPGNAASAAPAISGDGRFVAYQSLAPNLGCASSVQQILRTDLDSGQPVCVSQTSGVPGNGASAAPAISGDGHFVAYQSLAPNLAPGCTNGVQHVLRTDLGSGQTTCLSQVPGGVGNGPSGAPAISADGIVVAFESTARNLDPACTTGVQQVFVSRGGNALCFSLTQSGAAGDGPSSGATVSGDGLVLTFATRATNLASGSGAALGAPPATTSQVGDFTQIIRRSAGAGAAVNRLISESAGTAGNGPSVRPSLNLNGTIAAFQTTASNLVSGDTNEADDVLVTTEQPPPPPGRVAITAPANGTQFPLSPPTLVRFAWTVIPGVMQYGFEFTGPNRVFANPNGTAPDPVSGFGGAGGGLLVPATSFTAVLDASFPPGTYQVRVVGLSASGGRVGTFSDAITVILGPGVFISPNARPAITAPAVGTQLVPGAQATFTWTVVPGVARYLFEVTGPNQGFANPNGAAPDPGALGSVVVPGTALVAPVPTGLPSGTYQVRVIALTAAGQPIGTFSDAVTVVVP